MSKAIRIRQHLYDEIERLAHAERRSMIAQLEVLLEQALRLQGSGAVVGDGAVSGSALSMGEEETGIMAVRTPRPERTAPDDHFRPDFGGKLK